MTLAGAAPRRVNPSPATAAASNSAVAGPGTSGVEAADTERAGTVRQCVQARNQGVVVVGEGGLEGRIGVAHVGVCDWALGTFTVAAPHELLPAQASLQTRELPTL